MMIVNKMKENLETGIHIQTVQFTEVYTVSKDIGRGKFAVVKKCRHNESGVDYAAKFIHKRRKGVDCRQDILNEVRMLQLSLKHPRIVHLVEVFETNHDLIIVTEYAGGGELFQYIVMEERLDERCVKRLLLQLLDGLAFLHSENIVHMDIKPQNILLTEALPAGDIKLCDLGLARSVNCGEDVLDIIGTPDYVAPEVLSYEPLNAGCDMWSVGVLAYVMLTGCSPFAGDTKQETFLNISQVNLDFPDDLFDGISKDAVDFISRLLVKQPQGRMTATESLDHAWLAVTQSEDTPTSRCLQPLSVGSPAGQRRTLASTSTDDLILHHEPVKKCKCDKTDLVPASSPTIVGRTTSQTAVSPPIDDQLTTRPVLAVPSKTVLDVPAAISFVFFDPTRNTSNNHSVPDTQLDTSPTRSETNPPLNTDCETTSSDSDCTSMSSPVPWLVDDQTILSVTV